MKILITGATGFIGKALTDRLLSLGHKVIGVSRTESSLVHSNYQHMSIDLDKSSFDLPDVDTVYHLANASHASKIADAGIEQTKNFLNSFGGRTPKLIYSSTAAVYGEQNNFPIKETAILNPNNSYGKSKAEAEKYINDFCIENKIPLCIARIFNCYGSNQSLDFFIPSLIKRIKSTDINLEIYNGNCTRDFIHLNDVVEALIVLGKIPNSGIYNIGTGIETTVREAANILIEISDKKFSLKEVDNYNLCIIMRSYADISKMLSLGWSPKVLLRDGLKAIYDSS